MDADTTAINTLTGMKLDRWQFWLDKSGYRAQFPEKCTQLLRGITRGVDIEFVGDRTTPRFGKNLRLDDPSHAEKIDAVIAADVLAGKKAGPFVEKPHLHFVVSPIGAVPKKASEKIRVIHHLSFPFKGQSVNEDIVEEYLPLSSFATAADAVRALGIDCFLIKLDVEAAYKQIPVRREDWHLLGFMWRGMYYYERVLPFGLKSSCRLWDLYADALHWILKREFRIDVVIHYIDDFLLVCRNRSDAERALRATLDLCADLGMPMAPNKTEGPTHCLTFLGIELDTHHMRARLPDTKLAELRALAEVWVGKSSATVAELQSLVGSLSFACQVVRPGRYFLRRIIGHSARVARITSSRTKHYLSLPADAIEDVRWWLDWIVHWNGISLLYDAEWRTADKLTLFTDACGDGLGARFGDSWIEARWTDAHREAAQRESSESMPFLELYALVTAAATWGARWNQRRVVFRCDCLPVVQAIAGKSSNQPALMHLLRILCILACQHGFDFRVEHIPGVENTVADTLSRFGDCEKFRQECPRANLLMTPIVHVPLPPTGHSAPTPSQIAPPQ